MRFAGDEDFAVVPIVYRVPDTDPGDCNHDLQVNLSDWAQFSGCLSGPVAPYVGDCECADFDGDTDADLADFAQYQTTYVYPLPPVVFVDASATGGNNGSSWTDAFTELQAALDVAVEGDEVWVAAGRYTPDYDVGTGVHTGSRDAAFLATAGVGIYGGFAGGEVYKHHRDLAANAAILSGDLAGNDGPGFANNGENSYHVVTVSASGFGDPPVIDGCTIAGGNADGSWPDNAGGGVFNESQQIVLRACIVRANAASLLGGGLFQYNLGDSTLINCAFTGNTADDGGAVYSDLQSVTVINSSFSGNTAGDVTGGVYCGAGSLTVSGSILWGNTAGSGSTEGAQIHGPTGATSVNYSCVEGWSGGLGGTGNIGANPAFADADGADDQFGTDDDDLRLLAGSPGIDAADNAAMPGGVVTDLDSNPRFVDDPSTDDAGYGTPPIVDMGAYEFQ